MKIGASYKFNNSEVQYIPSENRKEIAEKYLARLLADEIIKKVDIKINKVSEGIEYKCVVNIELEEVEE